MRGVGGIEGKQNEKKKPQQNQEICLQTYVQALS